MIKGVSLSGFLIKNDFDSKSKDDSRLSDKYDKTLNPFSTEYLNVFESQKKQKQKDSSAINRSTLSLHIAAYENSVEAAATDDKKQLLLLSSESSTKKTANICGKTWKGVKQLFSNSSSSMGAFEIPRQQNEDKVSEPEIMHFKSSQKLLNPNEEKATLKTKDERKKDKEKNEFEKLKEEANKLFKVNFID
uniref:Uncharacterized protein n=1 Tax=Panagrolaimus superbus TaxID=310955 RepID=A0A914Y5P1_9BILA